MIGIKRKTSVTLKGNGHSATNENDILHVKILWTKNAHIILYSIRE